MRETPSTTERKVIMASRKNVPGATVRAWLNSDEGQSALKAAGVATKVGSRGRHNPAQVEVFHKSNRNLRYETASEAEKRTVTVPVKVLDKAGRASTRPQTVTTEHARTLLGHPEGKRGRFNKADLSLALEAEFLSKM